MKQLILIRHAKSSWKHPELDDHERPLNNRGLKNAPVMGERLARRGVAPQLILSSTAVRARTTARLIAGALEYSASDIQESESIYAASWLSLLIAVQNLDDALDCVILVGHNPGITTVARHLANQPVQDLPTAACVHLEFDVTNWADLSAHSGLLLDLDYPKKSVPE